MAEQQIPETRVNDAGVTVAPPPKEDEEEGKEPEAAPLDPDEVEELTGVPETAKELSNL